MEVLKQAYDKAKDSAVLFNKIAHGKNVKEYSNQEKSLRKYRQNYYEKIPIPYSLHST